MELDDRCPLSLLPGRLFLSSWRVWFSAVLFAAPPLALAL